MDLATDRNSSQTVIKWLTALLAAAFVVRLLCMAYMPLLDPSESRYATIAQSGIDSGEWVVPTFTRGETDIPFTGKPPLYLWASMLSMKVFGETSFAARFPSFVSALLIIYLVHFFAKRKFGDRTAFNSVVCLVTTGGFYVLAGTGLFDMFLNLWVTLAFVMFPYAAGVVGIADKDEFITKRNAGALFFLGCALGVMTKGPVALIVIGFGIGLFLLATKNVKKIFDLPWVTGGVPSLLLMIVYFMFIEKNSPGFIEYFFVKENFMRYVARDYGDLFGSGHPRPYGIVWLYLLATTAPWCFLVFLKYKQITQFFKSWWKNGVAEANQATIYLVTWFLAAPIIFTFAKSTLFTYILPSLPAMAILIGDYINKSNFGRKIYYYVLLAPAAGVIATILTLTPSFNVTSTKNLFADKYHSLFDKVLYFYPKVPFSSLFYSRIEQDDHKEVKLLSSIDDLPRGSKLLSRKKLKEAELDEAHLDKVESLPGGWTVYERTPKAKSP